MAARPQKTQQKYRFTAAQRRDLEESCGLVKTQVDELESILPLCAALLRPPATMTQARAELQNAVKALRHAQRSLSRLLSGSSAAVVETRNRIIEVDFDVGNGADTVADTASMLAAARQRCEIALQRLPKRPRRGGSANPSPIRRIEKALLDGFVKHHKPPFPPYVMETSRNKPPFPQIVESCYEAIGRLESPDRAIREHLRLSKQARRTQRSRIQ